MARGHGGVVEEAEAHRCRAFGVMAGRPHGDEGVVDFARHHLLDRLAGAANGVERRLQRAWAHRRIAVEPRKTVAGRGLLQRLDIGFGVDAQRQFARALRGLVANERHEFFVFEDALDHTNAVRPFGVAGPIVVRETGGMGNQQRIQCEPTGVFPSRILARDLGALEKRGGLGRRGEILFLSIASFRPPVQRRLRINTKV